MLAVLLSFLREFSKIIKSSQEKKSVPGNMCCKNFEKKLLLKIDEKSRKKPAQEYFLVNLQATPPRVFSRF